MCPDYLVVPPPPPSPVDPWCNQGSFSLGRLLWFSRSGLLPPCFSSHPRGEWRRRRRRKLWYPSVQQDNGSWDILLPGLLVLRLVEQRRATTKVGVSHFRPFSLYKLTNHIAVLLTPGSTTSPTTLWTFLRGVRPPLLQASCLALGSGEDSQVLTGILFLLYLTLILSKL